jgi:cold shock CspA family protein
MPCLGARPLAGLSVADVPIASVRAGAVGVLLTPDGLTVFCHFSDVAVDGYKTLTPGSRVSFGYETPGQDGCDARVVSSARPAE